MKCEGNTIKCIPVKEPSWRDIHDLKDSGQRYDDPFSRMIRCECDYREWKMITEIDRDGEFVPFNPEGIMDGE